MKILSIHIKDHKQFKDTFIDFTDPGTGLAAEKICFIGRNGTGKSTLLRLIQNVILQISEHKTGIRYEKDYVVAMEICHENQNFLFVNAYDFVGFLRKKIMLDDYGQNAETFKLYLAEHSENVYQ